ncbi:hypothetical protein ABS767_08585 [Sphingomonas sp. ST-64]|uniref:Uncharacterized protein n=1 Tax=Sphingomonas plantiphila TaxID=3163295 RepID=A0ABW8YM83_9SPHN
MSRTTFAAMLIALTATPLAAQTYDPRIPAAEAEADRAEAQRMYEAQRRRDQDEADRVAKTNLDRQADYDLYIARQKADYEAKMAAWRADVARRDAEAARVRADWEARVARCKSGDRSACRPK